MLLAQAVQVVEKQRDWLDYVTLVVAGLGPYRQPRQPSLAASPMETERPRVEVSSSLGNLAPGPGSSRLIVITTAANVGRAPVTLTSFGFGFSDGPGMVFKRFIPGFDGLPHRLEPGASARFLVEASKVEEHAAKLSTPWVKLATGETVEGEPLRFAGIG